MKFTILVLVLTAISCTSIYATTTATAERQATGDTNVVNSASDGGAADIEAIAQDIIEDLKGAGKSGTRSVAVQELLEALKSSAAQGRHAGATKQGQNDGGAFVLRSQQHAKAFSGLLQAMQITLQEERRELKSVAKQRVLQRIEDSLNTLNEGAIHLDRDLQALIDRYNSQIIAPIQRGEYYWKQWSYKRLQNFAGPTNDANVQRAHQLLNDFQQQYAKLSSDYVAPLKEQLKHFDADADAVLSDYQEALQSLVAEVSECLVYDDSDESNTDCRLNVQEALKGLTPSQLVKLRKRVQLLMEELRGADFYKPLKDKIERLARSVQKELRQLATDLRSLGSFSDSDSSSSESDSVSSSESGSYSSNESDSSSEEDSSG